MTTNMTTNMTARKEQLKYFSIMMYLVQSKEFSAKSFDELQETEPQAHKMTQIKIK